MEKESRASRPFPLRIIRASGSVVDACVLFERDFPLKSFHAELDQTYKYLMGVISSSKTEVKLPLYEFVEIERRLNNLFREGSCDLVTTDGSGLFGERFGDLAGGETALERLVKRRDHHVAGDIACGMAAHAIGHDDQRTNVAAVILSELVDHVSVFLIVAGTIDLIACYVEFDFH